MSALKYGLIDLQLFLNLLYMMILSTWFLIILLRLSLGDLEEYNLCGSNQKKVFNLINYSSVVKAFSLSPLWLPFPKPYGYLLFCHRSVQSSIIMFTSCFLRIHYYFYQQWGYTFAFCNDDWCGLYVDNCYSLISSGQIEIFLIIIMSTLYWCIWVLLPESCIVCSCI